MKDQTLPLDFFFPHVDKLQPIVLCVSLMLCIAVIFLHGWFPWRRCRFCH